MKKKILYQFMALLTFLSVVFTSCKETVWPDVTVVKKADYLGIWNAQTFRAKTTYIRTTDLITGDFLARDTTVTDSTTMKFELGIARISGFLVEDSIRVTSTLTKNKIAQTPVVKTGYYTIGETSGSDYTQNLVYLNIWENKANVNTGFANPIAEPYTTYTVLSKSATDMELRWVLYNNSGQNSVMYKVTLKK